MICTLTARRVQGGRTDDFATAFKQGVDDIPDDVRKRWTNVYVCRDVTDENVILSFGFFDGTLEELREIQARYDRDAQVATLEPLVASVLLDGSYEVIEELTP
jgi:hypothetical protein